MTCQNGTPAWLRKGSWVKVQMVPSRFDQQLTHIREEQHMAGYQGPPTGCGGTARALGGSTPTPAAPTGGSEVRDMLGQCEDQVRELGCALGALADRLEVIVTPNVQGLHEQALAKAPERTPLSPLRERLFDHCVMLKETTRAVHQLMGRIEL